MELGQKVFRPVGKPDCESCPVRKCCGAYQAGIVGDCPKPKLKTPKIELALRVIMIRRADGKLGLLQRDASVPVLKGYLGFPTEFVSSGESEGFAVRFLAEKKGEIRPLGTFKHSITKWKIEAEVWLQDCESVERLSLPHLKWYSKEEILSQLIASFDQKAWKVFSKFAANERPQLSFIQAQSKEG